MSTGVKTTAAAAGGGAATAALQPSTTGSVDNQQKSALLATTATTLLLFAQEREQSVALAKQRLEKIRNRPTRAVAIEFFKSFHGDWKSLPSRIAKLCQSMEEWESLEKKNNIDDDDDEFFFYDSCSFENIADAKREARLSALTASIMSLAPKSFPKAFESLLRASLEQRDHGMMINDDVDNEDDESEYIQALSFMNDENNNNMNNNNNNNIEDDQGIEMSLSYPDAEMRLFENIRKTGWIIRRRRRHCGSLPNASSSTSSTTTTGLLLHQQLCQAIHQTVLRKVKKTIDEDEDYSPNLFQDQVQQWKEQVVEPWLVDLLHGNNNDQQQQHQRKQSVSVLDPMWKKRLDVTVAEAYASVRMEQIFSIVTDYPESHGAVLELKELLEQTQNQHSELASRLRNSLIRRLNHPGANTSQIIDVYIATIKVLRLIDPSDRLLAVVAEPVRTYLRGRNDTVRCIITSLTDAEVGGDLYQELRRQDAKPLENVTVDSDDEEEPPDLHHWQPPPSINKARGSFLKPINGGKSSDDCDILAMLVSIYGSKELFVDEYRLMLADKLLANLDYNTDKEVHTLELLKLRFGELSMRNCEVMIKDMDDSKRSNTLIHSTIESNPPLRRRTEIATPESKKCVVDSVMISHIFWPTLQNKEPLKHHPRIQSKLDDFTGMYSKLKNPRRLEWIQQLGTVELEIDVVEESEDGSSPPHVETKEFSCSPLLATLISHFEDKPTWTAEELANETGIPEHVIQKRMAFWVSNRVVTISRQPSSSSSSLVASSGTSGTIIVYELASRAYRQQEQGDNEHGDGGMMMMDDDEADKAVSASAQEQEDMETFESFITAMLTNTGQSSLDRIHNMLKMFVSAGSETKYNKTPQQLNAFLQQLCRQEKLECGPDGMYKLFKK